MTAALEIRLILYGLLSLGVISATAYATHKLDDARYESLRSDFSGYKAQVATDDATAHTALANALQAQIDSRNATEARNAQLQTSLQSVQADAVAAHRDVDFANRLLAAAAHAGTAAASSAVSKAQGGSGAADTPGASGDRSTPNLIADVTDSATECRDAIQRLAALQLEIAPQI